MESKQVIVLRKDLKMRKGKMVAQGAHASLAIFFNRIKEVEKDTITIGYLNEEMLSWVSNSFTKIAVGVESEEELLEIYQKAKDEGLPVSLIEDAGKTEFGGKATKTAVAVGPAGGNKVDLITGHLKLL